MPAIEAKRIKVIIAKNEIEIPLTDSNKILLYGPNSSYKSTVIRAVLRLLTVNRRSNAFDHLFDGLTDNEVVAEIETSDVSYRLLLFSYFNRYDVSVRQTSNRWRPGVEEKGYKLLHKYRISYFDGINTIIHSFEDNTEVYKLDSLRIENPELHNYLRSLSKYVYLDKIMVNNLWRPMRKLSISELKELGIYISLYNADAVLIENFDAFLDIRKAEKLLDWLARTEPLVIAETHTLVNHIDLEDYFDADCMEFSLRSNEQVKLGVCLI